MLVLILIRVIINIMLYFLTIFFILFNLKFLFICVFFLVIFVFVIKRNNAFYGDVLQNGRCQIIDTSGRNQWLGIGYLLDAKT